ncbi:MAG TPA: hypothetical protein VHZ09_11580 [Acidobacteriaceae bacterium]|jgi:hypothetical protein|nr:hypothetical protein [Acidobacteriaceae bacterium]
MSSSRFGSLCAFSAGILLTTLFGIAAQNIWAAASSAVSDAEDVARHALDAAAVQTFDGSLTYVSQSVVEKPVADASREINYAINGPDAGAKGSVEYRIYDSPTAAEAHATPSAGQTKQEASQNDLPHGQFRTYHSALGGSALAQEVPGTFRCMALASKGPWSRCYYHADGANIVVVGTTTSSTANEAILITAMGAQRLVVKKQANPPVS